MANISLEPGETRESRREDRREQLLDVAMHLFSVHGFAGTTTKDIAKAAKVSPGLLYHYYDSKEALMLGIVERFRKEGNFESIVRDNDKGPIRVALLSILTALAHYMDQHLDEIWMIVRAATSSPKLHEALMDFHGRGELMFIEFFRKRMERGEIINVKAPRRLAGILCNIIMTERLVQAPDRNDVESIVDAILMGLVPRSVAEDSFAPETNAAEPE